MHYVIQLEIWFNIFTVIWEVRVNNSVLLMHKMLITI